MKHKLDRPILSLHWPCTFDLASYWSYGQCCNQFEGLHCIVGVLYNLLLMYWCQFSKKDYLYKIYVFKNFAHQKR